MESSIARIEELGVLKRLIPAEPIIMEAIDTLSPFLNSSLPEADYSRIHKALLSLSKSLLSWVYQDNHLLILFDLVV